MKIVRGSILMLGLLFAGKVFAMQDEDVPAARFQTVGLLFASTATIGFLLNVFVSEPKTILEVNAYGTAGLAGVAGALKVLCDQQINAELKRLGFSQKELAIVAASGDIVGIVAARLVNMMVRNVYGKVKSTCSSAKIPESHENSKKVMV